GIRVLIVTGVQTCALPIFWLSRKPLHARSIAKQNLVRRAGASNRLKPGRVYVEAHQLLARPMLRRLPDLISNFELNVYGLHPLRSEERRVGKGWRCRWRG